MVNLSVRGTVGGGNVLIPAFVVSGGSRLVLMRVVGPGLAQFGVSGTLARPILDLYQHDALVATNEGWRNGFEPDAVHARSMMVGAFPLNSQSADSAVLKALSSGAYIIEARGAGSGTGIALIEIYDANGIEKPVLTP